MCGGGGGGSKKPAPPVQMGYTYSPSDRSNTQRQAAAVETDKAAASYGSELSTTAAPAPTNGGL